MKQNDQQRPTPETDAKQSDFVLAGFARRLERERDELAAKLVMNEAYQAGLCAERDEAREQLEAMREAIQHAASALEDWQIFWREAHNEQSGRYNQFGAAANAATAATLSKLQLFIKP